MSIYNNPCADCGAGIGEPCFPDCLGVVAQTDIDQEEISRLEDHDPHGDLADTEEDRMFGGDQ